MAAAPEGADYKIGIFLNKSAPSVHRRRKSWGGCNPPILGALHRHNSAGFGSGASHCHGWGVSLALRPASVCRAVGAGRE
ncbi:hypothetical protein AvCA_45030 [Azotobacter vinelandii CA]|uniref:Uncharacterized protein n=2 Tax=Azotobacter vinelandii TaxID=354 RepID=C1DGX3_AZOVD|nr:hypothetical protein Avin_45030 [Azotobacter vinelandii DJ]AGK14336.1 hypothetical protein AvCA_45030 [Azotobacter vinelandii CA]AGK22057.1 hypothetical protein AvCA6_45030 [Azotobacter vinelandii CA6]